MAPAGTMPSQRPKSVHLSLSDVFLSNRCPLLTVPEKVGRERDDPVVDHLYSSGSFRVMLWSTFLVAVTWLLGLTVVTAMPSPAYRVYAVLLAALGFPVLGVLNAGCILCSTKLT